MTDSPERPHRGSSDPTAGGARAAFQPTRWTLVLRARGQSTEAQQALGTLCEGYYAPIHAYIRAVIGDDEAARDLTQEFFARVLRGGAFDRADPGRGRFRSFLLGAVKHFLADMRDRRGAGKRGGGVEPIPLEPGTDTSPGFEVSDPQPPEVERLFDRRWATTLLERALTRLGAEMASAGKTAQFEALKPWLSGAGTEPQREAATRLGLSESALKVAIHRLRVRFRELVKAEIVQTVDDPKEVSAELNYLIEVVSG